MSLCPKDYKPCCDDLCHGFGCLRMDGYPMLETCDVCGGWIDEELDVRTCTCEPSDDYSDDCYDHHDGAAP